MAPSSSRACDLPDARGEAILSVLGRGGGAGLFRNADIQRIRFLNNDSASCLEMVNV